MMTPLIIAERSARLVVSCRKSGTYRYVCTLPGHAAAGPRGIFTVR
jgi:uncharacterized cupredoxin-like copper-binding protein